MHCFLYHFRTLKTSAPIVITWKTETKISPCVPQKKEEGESILNFAYTNSLKEPLRKLKGKSMYEKKIKEPDRQIRDKTGLLK